MREVKYRTWWSKTMCEVTCIDFAHNECFLKYQLQTTNDCIEKIVPLNEVKIMQWTGLKDKNDKEIYEGDIYKYYILVSAHDGRKFKLRQTEVVEYRDGAFWVGEYLLSEALAHDDGSVIIGNIYENPELLEGDN